jgi:hypothetical protein
VSVVRPLLPVIACLGAATLLYGAVALFWPLMLAGALAWAVPYVWLEVGEDR